MAFTTSLAISFAMKEVSDTFLLNFIASNLDANINDELSDLTGISSINEWSQRVHKKPIQQFIEEEMFTSKFRWVTILDKRTGSVDRNLSGKVFTYQTSSAPIPPLHPNCRCRREPVTDAEETREKFQAKLTLHD